MISGTDTLGQATPLSQLKESPDTENLTTRPQADNPRPVLVVSVTSGKGGVGKTAIVANTAIAMSRMGKKVLIIDANLGLANIDVIYGLTPHYNLNHFFGGLVDLNEILVEGPGGVKILPSGSGLTQMTRLKPSQKAQFIEGLDRLDEKFDAVLIDTEAGISDNVTYFNTAAQEVLLIATSDPASITDAYTLMKVLFLQFQQRNFHLLVNVARDSDEGLEVFQKLTIAADRFFDISLNYLGYIPFDENMLESRRRQMPLIELYPDSQASASFRSLAKGLLSLPTDLCPKGSLQFFWKNFLAQNPSQDS